MHVVTITYSFSRARLTSIKNMFCESLHDSQWSSQGAMSLHLSLVHIIFSNENAQPFSFIYPSPQGYHAPRAFIAAQSPLQSTVNDFWTLIAEKKVQTALLLCQLVEDSQVSRTVICGVWQCVLALVHTRMHIMFHVLRIELYNLLLHLLFTACETLEEMRTLYTPYQLLLGWSVKQINADC